MKQLPAEHQKPQPSLTADTAIAKAGPTEEVTSMKAGDAIKWKRFQMKKQR